MIDSPYDYGVASRGKALHKIVVCLLYVSVMFSTPKNFVNFSIIGAIYATSRKNHLLARLPKMTLWEDIIHMMSSK